MNTALLAAIREKASGGGGWGGCDSPPTDSNKNKKIKKNEREDVGGERGRIQNGKNGEKMRLEVQQEGKKRRK